MTTLFPDRFSVSRLLRNDTTATTFVAKDLLLEQREVLVKLVPKTRFARDDKNLVNHFSWFMGVKHDQLSEIIDVGLTAKKELYLVREYFPPSNLLSADPFKTMLGLVSAVDFLQSHFQIHGAIKPTNIFCYEDTLRLADPQVCVIRIADRADDIRFSAPEVLQGKQATRESDLYSVGAVLHKVLTGRDLFDDIDLTHLKTKCMWASPQPLTRSSALPQSVLELVSLLLHRDPQKRTAAFSALKTAIHARAMTARRAPFVGRDDFLKDMPRKLNPRSTPTLKVLLVEGIPGIGKSRLVQELRNRFAFEAASFIFCRSQPEAVDFLPLKTGIRSLFRRFRLYSPASLEGLPSTLAQHIIDEAPPQKVNAEYSKERTASDLVALLRWFALRTALFLVVEDIQAIDYDTLRALNQLVLRATEMPMTLILTCRPPEPGAQFLDLLRTCLNDDFIRLNVSPLNPSEARLLCSYFQDDLTQQEVVLRLAGNSPLFIEEYAKSRAKSLGQLTNPVQAALDWMLSRIDESARDCFAALSLARKPLDLGELSRVAALSISSVQDQLAKFTSLGFIEQLPDGIRLLYPDLGIAIYKSLPRKKKLELAKRSFQSAQTMNHDPEDLAFYAFEAELFEDAGRIYEKLATESFDSNNYTQALIHFEQLEKCMNRISCPLSDTDKLKLSWCYVRTGTPARGRSLCKELLSRQSVHEDPEFLSRLYYRLAHTFDGKSLDQRLRFMRLSVECLPSDSPQLWYRYLTLCDALIKAGDLVAASSVLQQAEQIPTKVPGERWNLDFVHGMLLMQSTDFANALGFFFKAHLGFIQGSKNLPIEAGLLNNIAYCFENIGGLSKALRYQLLALQNASRTGLVGIEIQSLVNIGSIKTKLGEMTEAAQLFGKALEHIQRIGRPEESLSTGVIGPFSDAALYCIHVGEYRRAAEYLREATKSLGSVYELDKVQYQLIECLFFVQMNASDRVNKLLSRVRLSPAAKLPFIEIEETLLTARYSIAADKDKTSELEAAGQTSNRMGTLYQECNVLIELAVAYASIGDKIKAQEYSKRAIKLAERKSFRLLAVRARLVCGLEAERQNEKQRWLLAAYESASEIGLPEPIAESAFHLGMLHLESGRVNTAREYLLRSVLTTERLTEEVPEEFRAGYLAKSWRREARNALDRTNLAVSRTSSSIGSSRDLAGRDKYFRAAYQLSVLVAGALSPEAVASAIENALKSALSRSALILLSDGKTVITRAVRINPTDNLVQRVRSIGAKTQNRIYLGPGDRKADKEPIAWIPLKSAVYEGGIYVESRQNRLPFREDEVELLTIFGNIANGALGALERLQGMESESILLSEFHGLIGGSKPMRAVYSQIQIAAGNTATVLIEGESGTGKELVAKAIHAAGPRSKQPFIPVDCGAIPETLIEAELFGAKKGSYTGALSDRSGLFEAAHGGTLFLDEVSNTTPALQAKLLRVVQEREVRRLGETKGRSVDVRLIVASNTSLEALANDGRFRKDLLYRLKVLQIKLPPLRMRQDDIPMLVHAFLQKLNTFNKTNRYFAAGLLRHLSTQTFRGNVRELQNAVERAFYSSKGIIITEIPLEDDVQATVTADEIQAWFNELSEGRKDFWSAVHTRYKKRDISREKILALVDLGLRSTRGSYKTLAAKFRLKEREYRRFMDFLRRNECLLDFRPYRKPTDKHPE